MSGTWQVARVFHTKAAAERHAISMYGARIGTKGMQTPGRARQLLDSIKHLGTVYGAGHHCLVPGDLADACSRRVTDRDLFQCDPGLEIISIMLKYRPVRTAFSFALRTLNQQTTGVAGSSVIVSKAERCLHIYQALVLTAKEMSMPCHAGELHLWHTHWGRHVSHHSGWLPFLQRRPPSGITR